MGVDIYGRKPSSKNGRCFNDSYFGWRPLWEYLETIAPELTRKVKYPVSNDGDGLNARDTAKLAAKLQAEIASGRTAEYAAALEARHDAMPNESCWLCGGTGKRLPVPNVGSGDEACNACDSTGALRPMETDFEAENAERFATFLADSGGFEIW